MATSVRGGLGAVLWGPILCRAPGAGRRGACDRHRFVGNVFVAGDNSNHGSTTDFVTLKYRGTDGATLWGPVFFDGEGHASDSVYLARDRSSTTRKSRRRRYFPDDRPLLRPRDAEVRRGNGRDALGPGLRRRTRRRVHGRFQRRRELGTGRRVELGRLPHRRLRRIVRPGGLPRTRRSPTARSRIRSRSSPKTARRRTCGPDRRRASGRHDAVIDGILSGTPDEEGDLQFTVGVSDAAARRFDATFRSRSAAEPTRTARSRDYSDPCSRTLSFPGPYSSYVWLPGGQTTPEIVVAPVEATTYGLIVSDGLGCPIERTPRLP